MTAFPSITAVTLAFASNEDPLGSPWLANTYTGGTTTLLKSVSGVALKGPISATGFGMQVLGSTFGPDMEMWQKVVTVTATNGQEIFANFLRLQQDGAATVDGYVVYAELASGADTWHIDRINNGSQTNLANATQDVTAGGYVAAKIEDSGGNPVITGYWCPAANDPTIAASWTQVVTFTDTSGSKVTGTGRCGLECQGIVTTFDDLRAGTIVAGGTDATVTVPAAASGTADIPAPTVTADSAVTLPPATGAGDMPAADTPISVTVQTGPLNSTGDLPDPAATTAADATVTAPPADGTAALPTPTVAAGSSPAVPPADATGATPAPTVTADSAVTLPPATGAGTLPAPTVTSSSASDVPVPPADATGALPAPTVTATAEQAAPAAAAAGSLPAPTINTGDGNATVTAVPAAGTGDLPAPAVSSPPPPSHAGNVNPRRRRGGHVSRDENSDRPLILRR